MKNRKQRKEKTMEIQATLVNTGWHFLCKACWFKTNALAEHFFLAHVIGLQWCYLCYDFIYSGELHQHPSNKDEW